MFELSLAERLTIKALPEAESAARLLFAELSEGGFTAIKERATSFGLRSSLHEAEHGALAEKFIPDSNPARTFDRKLAYKVLDIEGRSPAAPGVQWSLPQKTTDGVWRPGAWMKVGDTPVGSYPFGHLVPGGRSGLHVSNVPEEWNLGHAKVRTFEAEIGEADKSVWQKLLDNIALSREELTRHGSIPPTLRDFPAANVRLIREIQSP